MTSFQLASGNSQCPSRLVLLLLGSAFYVLSGQAAGVQATELPGTSFSGGGGGTVDQRQIQNQTQAQTQTQFQDQDQTQRQGDNRVDVDGDDNDYFALAIPNLVAANCAGQSYSLGAGAAGFGFGLGQAQIDRNCQIAKAIATAHLLQKTGLVRLESYEYRRALCQMHGMEHVCNEKRRPKKGDPYCVGEREPVSYPGWCRDRIAKNKRLARWSDRDLRACGLGRRTFATDVENWGARGYCKPRHPKKRTHTPPVVIYPKPSHVTVRTGKHCGYDRVVFDWPKTVGYDAERRDDKVVVDFDRARDIDVSGVSSSLGRHILDAYAEKNTYGGTRVTLIVGGGVKHKVWRLDRRVIVDVKKPGCRHKG